MERLSRIHVTECLIGCAPLRRRPAGWIPARIGRLFAGVGHRHPARKSSVMTGLMRLSKRGVIIAARAQYSAVQRIRAEVAVCNIVYPANQPESASYLKSATSDVSFLRSDSRCRRNVSVLSDVIPRHLDSE